MNGDDIPDGPRPQHPDAESGFVNTKAVADYFALSIEVIEQWTLDGHLVEALSGLYDLNDCIGRVRRAAKGSR